MPSRGISENVLFVVFSTTEVKEAIHHQIWLRMTSVMLGPWSL